MISLKKSLDKYTSFGGYFLVTPNRQLVIFGKPDKYSDLVVRTRTNLVTSKFGFCDTDMQMNYGSPEVESLYEKTVQMFMSPDFAGFTLSSSYVSALHDTISHADATHLRFYSDSKDLKVSVFNYRHFVADMNIRNDGDPVLYESKLIGSRVFGSINFTIDANTFSKLPTSNYEVQLLENGLANFIDLDGDIEFFIRGQNLEEPIVKFVTEQHGDEICLSLHSKIT